MKKKVLLILIFFCPLFYSQNWVKVEGTSNEGYSVEVNPQNKNTIWFGHSDSEIFISHDGGFKAVDTLKTPASHGEFNPVTSIFIHPIDTNLIFVTTFNGTFKSTDYGETWSTYLSEDSLGANGEAVINDPQNPDTIYAGLLGSGKTFFRSYDRGNTWEDIEMNGFSFCSITALNDGSVLGGSVDGGVVIRSSDNGITWDTVYMASQNSRYEIPKITLDPNINGRVWAAVLGIFDDAKGFLIKSDDFGKTWSEVNNLGDDTNPWAIDVDILGRIIVGMFVHGEKGAYISNDNGLTWNIYSTGFPSQGIPLVWMVKSNGDSLGIFVCDSNLGSYKLNNTIVSVDEQQTGINSYYLYQNFPNPFNPVTRISWQSAVGSWQSLKVYDLHGSLVATLVNEYKSAGKYEIGFDASGLASGIYFYRLKTDSFTEVKSMLLIK